MSPHEINLKIATDVMGWRLWDIKKQAEPPPKLYCYLNAQGARIVEPKRKYIFNPYEDWNDCMAAVKKCVEVDDRRFGQALSETRLGPGRRLMTVSEFGIARLLGQLTTDMLCNAILASLDTQEGQDEAV